MSGKQKIVMTSAVSVLIFLLLMIFWGKNGYSDYRRLQKEKADLVEQSNGVEGENAKLYQQIKRLNYDPRYVENIARQELGMIGKDEMIFKFKEDTHGQE